MTENNQKNEKSRPPIVVVMGHVDHGKTSLLDYIRKTNVTAREAGGITQTIGAYEITHNSKLITFIDTPGHEAFSKMRARGAQAADLAILVVAADEGVKPQTKEALSQIQAAKLPFIVAINKIDKPDINLDKVKNELLTAGVLLEGYGGNVSWQAISAKTGQGVGELLDLILLAAEMESLKYDPKVQAKGIVVEALRDNRRGLVVSVIVEDGTLKSGENINTPTAGGKIKSLKNFLGEDVKSLEPSAPALILGFDSLPQIGEEFLTGEITFHLMDMPLPVAKKSLAAKGEDSDKTKVILKADNAGSLEALVDIIKFFPAAKPVEIVDFSVGRIDEGDFRRAADTKALIIGFRTKLDPTAENL
ncbi:MAG: translation initiation factor IF-2, partial [Candidatus Paceibacterota bacterium]